MAQQIQLRNGTSSAWSTANSTLAQGEMGVTTDTNIFKIGTGSTAWNSLATAPTASPTQTIAYRSLGDGGDGNVTISSGTTTLTRDMFYNNLTISGTGSIFTNGYRIFVKNILDLSNAPVGAINFNGANGANASGSTPGAVGTAIVAGSVAGTQAGSAGFAGVTLNGGSSASAGGTGGNGGSSNSSGAGGIGLFAFTFTVTAGNTASVGAAYSVGTFTFYVTTALTNVATSLVTIGTGVPPSSGTLTFVSGTGTGPIVYSAVGAPAASNGLAAAGTTSTNPLFLRRFESNLIRGVALVLGGSGGRGGSAGSGDGVNSSGAGGAGGNGAGVMALYVNTIVRSSNTPSGVIQCIGGNGGNGGNATTGITGGGGGGSAGGGGWIYLAYNSLAGPTITNFIQADGGTGGTGGNGFGTVNPTLGSGSGGMGAYGGRITLFNIVSQTGLERYGDATALENPEVTTGNLSQVQFGLAPGDGAMPGLCRVTI